MFLFGIFLALSGFFSGGTQIGSRVGGILLFLFLVGWAIYPIGQRLYNKSQPGPIRTEKECRRCGHLNSLDNDVCEQCGTKINLQAALDNIHRY